MVKESSDSHAVSQDSDDSVLGSSDDGSHTLEEQAAVLGYYETVVVNRSKTMVYLALLLAATATSLVTFFLVRQGEIEKFESDFKSFTKHAFDTVDSKVKNTYSAVKSLSTSVTSSTLDSEASFPNFTMSHFDLRVKEALALSACESISFAPVVELGDRESWEAYAQSVVRGSQQRGGQGGVELSAAAGASETIRPAEGGDDADLLYHVPLWQMAPTPEDTSVFLQDMFTLQWFRNLSEVAFERNDAVISQVLKTVVYDVHDQQHNDGHGGDHEEGNHSVEDDGPASHEKEVLFGHHEREGEGHGNEETHSHGRRLFENYEEHEGDESHVDHGDEGHHDDGHDGESQNNHGDEDHHDDDDDDDDDDDEGYDDHDNDDDRGESLDHHDEDEHQNRAHSHSVVMHSVLKHFEEDHEHEHSHEDIAGYVIAVLPWDGYFTGLLPEGKNGFVITVRDTCGSALTYVINGKSAEYIGVGDLHDPAYDYLVEKYELSVFSANTEHHAEHRDSEENSERKPEIGEHEHHPASHIDCDYTVYAYPSDKLRNEYETEEPFLFAAVIFAIYCFTGLVFLAYDLAVQRRQKKVLATATRTTEIVGSLFPKSVQQRLLKDAEQASKVKNDTKRMRNASTGGRWRGFMGEKELGDEEDLYDSPPIADLFPNATIIFADIVGFTAWSSTREPCQVFSLLENIYHKFDEIAKARKVFKVETIGDCYVAVAGLPAPRKDHAICMARFARDCLHKFNSLTKHLEERLGPDTADLGLRIGLHSGPVTAGVLRGERARFQLFGDTVNTTSRMETNGAKNKIHVSEETAKLLIAGSKGHWLRKRDDKIVAKGKGELTSYWLSLVSDSKSVQSGSIATLTDCEGDERNEGTQPGYNRSKATTPTRPSMQKHLRLVNWNVEILSKLLRHIVARRKTVAVQADPIEVIKELERKYTQHQTLILEEVQEVITLPKYDAKAAERHVDVESIVLDQAVVRQLQTYVQTIAELYRSNSFHNFEHVSHVAMSVVKLLSRIVAPGLPEEDEANEKLLHDHTYGITSDPLTQFACVFSALVHDVDHQGVPNSQLVKEQATIASVYQEKSVAEQNSVAIAWDLLMDPGFADLRRAIYTTTGEFLRFRQLVVNSVMATDIMDKGLSAARKARWGKAFAEVTNGGGIDETNNEHEDVNRKATIVIEHLIQASDVAHTMQHWHIYRKWNGKLFAEMTKAYKDGRAENDPADTWYKGELGFFDFYIIPLAKKLKECGVFGVSSDEYLSYAQKNRDEWESRGREMVAEMVESLTTPESVEVASGGSVGNSFATS